MSSPNGSIANLTVTRKTLDARNGRELFTLAPLPPTRTLIRAH
jgi:hypothetical protein